MKPKYSSRFRRSTSSLRSLLAGRYPCKKVKGRKKEDDVSDGLGERFRLINVAHCRLGALQIEVSRWSAGLLSVFQTSYASGVPLWEGGRREDLSHSGFSLQTSQQRWTNCNSCSNTQKWHSSCADWDLQGGVCGAAVPRSVLGLASSCLNLSSRFFSRTVMGGAPEAFWSEMRATRGMMGRTGSDCCFCRGERTAEEKQNAHEPLPTSVGDKTLKEEWNHKGLLLRDFQHISTVCFQIQRYL